MLRIIFCLTSLVFSSPLVANECLGWFLKSGLNPKTNDCELKCAVTPVDLGNFSCPSQCNDLCSKSLADQTGKPLELDEIEKEGPAKIKTKKLKVITSRFKEIPRGYYSK